MPSSSADILQEYLVKLGFQTDAISLKKFDNTLGSVGKKVLGVGVAVAGMVVAAERGVAAFAGAMEDLHYSSKLTNTSVAKLQSLRFAAEQIGVSGDTAAASVQNLATALKLKPGTVSILESFGIDTAGREGADITLDLLKKLKQEAPMVGAMWAEQLLGMDQETFLLTMANLDSLTKQYAAHQQTIKGAGTDMDQAAEVLKNYNNQLRTTEANLDRLGVAVAKNLAPTFTAVNEQLNVSLSYWTKFLAGDVETWDSAGQFFKDIPKAANNAVKATAGFINPWGHWDDFTKQESQGSSGSRVSGGKIKRPKAESDPASLMAALEQQHGLHTGTLDSIWKQESGRGKYMLSPKGAEGHFGFMPKTAKEYGLSDPNDFEASATAAAKKMANLLRWSKGDLPKALAGYNYGEGNVAAAGMNNLPAETRGYVGDNMQRINGSRLGGENAGNRPPLTLHQQTTIQVSGNGAESTAKAVMRGQGEVNSKLARDMAGRQAG